MTVIEAMLSNTWPDNAVVINRQYSDSTVLMEVKCADCWKVIDSIFFYEETSEIINRNSDFCDCDFQFVIENGYLDNLNFDSLNV